MLEWFTETGIGYLLGVAAVTLIGLVLVYRGVWGDRSKGRVRCPKCWYDMRGTVPKLECPECGHDAGQERWLHNTRRRGGRVVVGVIVLVLFGSIGGYVVWRGPVDEAAQAATDEKLAEAFLRRMDLAERANRPWQEGDDFDFRDVGWGMTKDEVADSEVGWLTFEKNDRRLSRIERVSGLLAIVQYWFIENSLTRGSYTFFPPRRATGAATGAQYLSEHDQIKAALTEKYGAPTAEQTVWVEGSLLKKQGRQQLAAGLMAGDVGFVSTWRKDSATVISCELSLVGDLIMHRIYYWSIYYRDVIGKDLDVIDKDLKAKRQEGL